MAPADRAYRIWGFSSAKEYAAGLAALPKILARRAFAPLLPADVIEESGAEMKRCMVGGWWGRAEQGGRRVCSRTSAAGGLAGVRGAGASGPPNTAGAPTRPPPPAPRPAPPPLPQGPFALVCMGIGMMLGERVRPQ
jgi:hypothetical protein